MRPTRRGPSRGRRSRQHPNKQRNVCRCAITVLVWVLASAAAIGLAPALLGDLFELTPDTREGHGDLAGIALVIQNHQYAVGEEHGFVKAGFFGIPCHLHGQIMLPVGVRADPVAN